MGRWSPKKKRLLTSDLAVAGHPAIIPTHHDKTIKCSGKCDSPNHVDRKPPTLHSSRVAGKARPQSCHVGHKVWSTVNRNVKDPEIIQHL